MFLEISLTVASVFLFLFIFWLRLKEDYTSGLIFNTSLYVLVGILVGFILSLYFLREWWFWFASVGILLGSSTGIYKYKMRFFEVLEALVASLLPWLIFIFLSHALLNRSLTSMIAVLFGVLLVILLATFSRHYKKFSWYKSGRIGFSGLTVLGLMYLARSLVASFKPDVLSFAGKEEVWLSAAASFVSFLSVFILARAKT